MVKGFGVFRERFQGYEDCYTIIGGTACDILMSEADLDFRATKDIDMILLIEQRFEEFAGVFWDFIKEGKYKCGWKSCDQPYFYRFTEPENREFPVMIELFSRRPEFQLGHMETTLTPLPVSDDISSLSAIMLDEDYYQMMLKGRKTIEGVSVLTAEYLIPFKIKAFLDLSQKKNAGKNVSERDLKKHKNDVFRLYSIADVKAKISLSDAVKAEMNEFLRFVCSDFVNLKDLKLEEFTLEEITTGIRNIYQLDE